MLKIKDISKIKGREVITVKPNTSIGEAIDTLVNHRIGALPVCDTRGALVGILSERDVLSWVHRGTPGGRGASVRDIMTREVVIGDPEDNVEDVLSWMTEKGVRHLPIVHENVLIGILSFRDVIGEQLSECSTRVRYLSDYISGGFSE